LVKLRGGRLAVNISLKQKELSMKKISILIMVAAVALLAAPVWAQNAAAPATAQDAAAAPAKEKSTVKLETDADKMCYALGTQLGALFQQFKMQPNKDMLFAGVEDAMANREPAIAEKDARALFQAAGEKAKKEMEEKNTVEGKAFLEANAKKEGVKTTPSGLQYKVIKEGEGANPKLEDKVQVNYSGKLINGTEFDSSYKRGTPATFPLGQVIKGWTEGLQLMKKGAKYELYIPAEIGYGARGQRNIPPNSVLVFEVELLDINPPEPPKPDMPTGGPAGAPAGAGQQVTIDAKPATK
jgi:FKBP-type peptidyl-prolyl cis-trans isomerase FklB